MTVEIRRLLGVLVILVVGCKSNEPTPQSGAVDSQSQAKDAVVIPFNELKEIAAGLRAAPLVSRSAPTTDTRFDSLRPIDQGIDFGHEWTPPEGYRLEIYNSLPGGGVCIGDYDGDGLPDIFLTQAHVGSALYRNLGGMRFTNATADAGLVTDDRGQGAAFVDVDNDDDLDLYVCRDERPNQLFLNNGQGKFTEAAEAAGLAFNGASVTPAFADYDQDGDLDLYLVTNRATPTHEVSVPKKNEDGTYSIAPADREFVDVIVDSEGRARVVRAGQFDHLFRNSGDGTFVDVSDEAGIKGNYWGLSATWLDVDGDGDSDIYVSNDFYTPDQLYRNNGDGTFTDISKQAFAHTPWYSMGTDAADINNDGWIDLMGSDMSATNHYKQKASMGDMGTTGWFLVHPTPRQYMRNALYLNTGTTRFMEIAALAGVANTDWTWSLKFGDLDDDGWIDLYVTNGMNRDWTNSDLRNQANATDDEKEKMDIWLQSPQRKDSNLAFRNTGDLRFDAVGNDWGLADENVSYGAAFADLDRDGDLDLVVNNAETAPSLYRNQTHTQNRVLIRLKGQQSNRWGVGCRVTIQTSAGQQIRELTTTQGYMASNEPLLHFGLGSSDRIDELIVSWPNGNQQTYKDVSANQLLVIEETVASTTPTNVEVNNERRPLYSATDALSQIRHQEVPFNDFGRQPLLPNKHSQLGPRIAWGDVDGDSDLDAFVGGASGQAGRLLINDGGGQFAPLSGGPWEADANCEDMGVAFFDANNDGALDLYVVSGGVECEPGDAILQDRIYINDRNGHFQNETESRLPELFSSGSMVRPFDFDGDGDMDLFIGGRIVPGRYPIAPESQLLVNDNGQFINATNELAPLLQRIGLVTDAAWCDVNGDEAPDLVVALEWGSIRLLLNKDGQLKDHSDEAGLKTTTGWYQSLAAADLDGDGDIDLATGNWGWNTKYHASDEKPSLLYYGDFEQTGRMRLVEAEFEDETLFPVRGKSCSTNAMPFLGNKFHRFHDFAIASLEEIYTPDCLDQAQRFAANSLTSGVWRNDGQGQFSFVPFPTIAQAAPICSIAIHDLNEDSIPDLLLAENFYGPQPETGHADGGVSQILIGKGDATFEALPAHVSGIVVPGDATDASIADIDGDGTPELIILTNDGPVFSFKKHKR